MTMDDQIPDDAFTPRHIKDAALELLKYGQVSDALAIWGGGRGP
jgi:hypothetical protein